MIKVPKNLTIFWRRYFAERARHLIVRIDTTQLFEILFNRLTCRRLLWSCFAVWHPDCANQRSPRLYIAPIVLPIYSDLLRLQRSVKPLLQWQFYDSVPIHPDTELYHSSHSRNKSVIKRSVSWKRGIFHVQFRVIGFKPRFYHSK